MTVYKNITFALEIQKLSKEQMDKRVKEALAEVQMSDYQVLIPAGNERWSTATRCASSNVGIPAKEPDG